MTYGIRERSAMIALAALGGSAPNVTLDKSYKLGLDKPQRERLNKAGLLSSEQAQLDNGRKGYAHTLTDAGWAFVESEMSADVPARAGSAGGALYALLASLKRPAEAAGGLKALLTGERAQPAPAQPTQPSTGDLRQQIRETYRALAKRPQDWVQLRDLRPRLKGAAKSEVDTVLKRMFLDKEINLTLNEDQGSLTQADREAAIRIGVNDMHMLSMG
jgi:hypothetical protein